MIVLFGEACRAGPTLPPAEREAAADRWRKGRYLPHRFAASGARTLIELKSYGKYYAFFSLNFMVF